MDKRDADRVIAAVDRLAETGHGDVTRLAGKGKELRLKVGPWRVRFTVADDRMDILRVLRRNEATYRDQ